MLTTSPRKEWQYLETQCRCLHCLKNRLCTSCSLPAPSIRLISRNIYLDTSHSFSHSFPQLKHQALTWSIPVRCEIARSFSCVLCSKFLSCRFYTSQLSPANLLYLNNIVMVFSDGPRLSLHICCLSSSVSCSTHLCLKRVGLNSVDCRPLAAYN